MVTILEDADVIAMGKFSEKSLTEKYLENLDELKAAEPAREGREKFKSFDAFKDSGVEDF